ncbi:MAG TPA: aminotransferase class I/II-fold pyridoxal phosphate-dependent enzyme [Pseudonocardiaceae bacterium]|jgi:histidinol-phosphate aminotransferase
MAANELPHEPPAPVRAAMAANVRVNRYPDPTYATLFSAVADDMRAPQANVMIGAGSSSILQRLIRVLCPGEGDAVMWLSPGFDAFTTFTLQAGAVAQRVPATSDGSTDLDAMMNAITPRTRMIILVNPHNPTGSVVTGSELRRFLDQIDDDVTVVLDEAYREFCDDPRIADGVSLAQARWASGHNNVAVVRTFSKAYGLAGLRVGYGIAPAPLARKVWDAAAPREISSSAAVAAVAALKAKSVMLSNAADIVRERERIRTELCRLGYAPAPSQANFLWLPLGDESGRFVEHCLIGGIRVLDVAERGVRVSIGTPVDNDTFLHSAHAWAARHASANSEPEEKLL